MFKVLTAFPYQMSLGATNDENLAYEYGKATAMEGRSIGANWSLSPVADLNLNPWNPLVGERSVGDDPEVASRLLKQVVRGMQENGIAACAKHFPGDGVDYRDQHRVTTCNSLSMEEWKKLSGKVFQELIDDGVYSIMAGHISLPAYQKELFEGKYYPPAPLSYELITKLLKEEMGFEGVVVTDSLGMGGILGYYESDVEMMIESFKAGCDLMLWPIDGYMEGMMEAVESGYISMERLDDAVSRILKMKEKLGLFEDNMPKPLSDAEIQYVKNVGKMTAEKSITLIRDDANNFPISLDKCKRIAVVPATHWQPAYKQADLLCDELRKRGFEVDCYADPENVFSKTRVERCKLMDSYDLIIYALFSCVWKPSGPENFTGEGRIPIQVALSHAVDKSVAVSFGSPYFMDEYFERGKTCVNAYSMNDFSVEAFVKAATGEINFTDFSPVKLTHSKWKPELTV